MLGVLWDFGVRCKIKCDGAWLNIDVSKQLN